MIELELIDRKLRQTNSFQSLNQLLQETMATCHISTYAFTYYAYHPKSVNKLKYEYASSNLKPWHQHYLEQRYEMVDQTLEVVYDSTLPIFWDVAQQFENASSERERQMRADSLKFGVTKGISIPIHGPHEDFAIFLVSQRVTESWLDQHPEYKHSLLVFAHYYYTAVRRLLLRDHHLGSSQGNFYNLNERELQCLTLVAEKYKVAEIAKKLSITERTVQFHIQNMNKKLGVNSKYLAVTKAIEKRIIPG